jgi:hypothetical protein
MYALTHTHKTHILKIQNAWQCLDAAGVSARGQSRAHRATVYQTKWLFRPRDIVRNTAWRRIELCSLPCGTLRMCVVKESNMPKPNIYCDLAFYTAVLPTLKKGAFCHCAENYSRCLPSCVRLGACAHVCVCVCVCARARARVRKDSVLCTIHKFILECMYACTYCT